MPLDNRNTQERFDPFLFVCLLAAAALCIVSLQAYPLWWDEGWSLLPAANLVNAGVYGAQQQGEAQPVPLAGSPLIVLPAALSFKAWGIGIVQARLPGLVFTLAALFFLYHVTAALYDRRAARIAAALFILLNGHVHLYPPLVGAQVLGEMPMVMFIFAGLHALWAGLTHLNTQSNSAKSFRRGLAFCLAALILWSFAYMTKLQARPFLLTALIFTAAAAAYLRQQAALLVCLVIAGLLCLLAPVAANFVYTLLPIPPGANAGVLADLLTVTAAVFDREARIAALEVIRVFGLPLIAALLYEARLLGPRLAAGRKLGFRPASPGDSPADSAGAAPGAAASCSRVFLLVLVGSWTGWYLLLSVGWPRYLFPAAALGLPLVAVITSAALSSLRNAARELFSRSRQGPIPPPQLALPLASSLLLAVIGYNVLGTTELWMRMGAPSPHSSTVSLVAELNRLVPEGKVFESYESELFFLADAEYHHPPAEVHVELNRRRFLRDAGSPLAIDIPDNAAYLVVGPFARANRLYRQAISRRYFRLVRSFCHAPRACPYQLYQRQ